MLLTEILMSLAQDVENAPCKGTDSNSIRIYSVEKFDSN